MGVFKNGRVEIIANDQGNRITPSYVAFTPEGERLIGDAAKNQLTSNPENTVFDAKRLIGRTWNDPSVQQDIKYLPFKVRLVTGWWMEVGGSDEQAADAACFLSCLRKARPLNQRFYEQPCGFYSFLFRSTLIKDLLNHQRERSNLTIRNSFKNCWNI